MELYDFGLRDAVEPYEALSLVISERGVQNEKWGEQNHTPEIYLAILVEEVGELAQEILNARLYNNENPNLMVEAVQVAAVSLAMVECLLRNKWR